MPNHAAVSTQVAASTGYSHHRTGISRVNHGLAMMSVGMPMITTVAIPATAARHQRNSARMGASATVGSSSATSMTGSSLRGHAGAVFVVGVRLERNYYPA